MKQRSDTQLVMWIPLVHILIRLDLQIQKGPVGSSELDLEATFRHARSCQAFSDSMYDKDIVDIFLNTRTSEQQNLLSSFFQKKLKQFGKTYEQAQIDFNPLVSMNNYLSLLRARFHEEGVYDPGCMVLGTEEVNGERFNTIHINALPTSLEIYEDVDYRTADKESINPYVVDKIIKEENNILSPQALEKKQNDAFIEEMYGIRRELTEALSTPETYEIVKADVLKVLKGRNPREFFHSYKRSEFEKQREKHSEEIPDHKRLKERMYVFTTTLKTFYLMREVMRGAKSQRRMIVTIRGYVTKDKVTRKVVQDRSDLIYGIIEDEKEWMKSIPTEAVYEDLFYAISDYMDDSSEDDSLNQYRDREKAKIRDILTTEVLDTTYQDDLEESIIKKLVIEGKLDDEEEEEYVKEEGEDMHELMGHNEAYFRDDLTEQMPEMAKEGESVYILKPYFHDSLFKQKQVERLHDIEDGFDGYFDEPFELDERLDVEDEESDYFLNEYYNCVVEVDTDRPTLVYLTTSKAQDREQYQKQMLMTISLYHNYARTLQEEQMKGVEDLLMNYLQLKRINDKNVNDEKQGNYLKRVSKRNLKKIHLKGKQKQGRVRLSDQSVDDLRRFESYFGKVNQMDKEIRKKREPYVDDGKHPEILEKGILNQRFTLLLSYYYRSETEPFATPTAIRTEKGMVYKRVSKYAEFISWMNTKDILYGNTERIKYYEDLLEEFQQLEKRVPVLYDMCQTFYKAHLNLMRPNFSQTTHTNRSDTGRHYPNRIVQEARPKYQFNDYAKMKQTYLPERNGVLYEVYSIPTSQVLLDKRVYAMLAMIVSSVMIVPFITHYNLGIVFLDLMSRPENPFTTYSERGPYRQDKSLLIQRVVSIT